MVPFPPLGLGNFPAPARQVNREIEQIMRIGPTFAVTLSTW